MMRLRQEEKLRLPGTPAPKPYRRWIILAVICVLLILIVGVSYYGFHRSGQVNSNTWAVLPSLLPVVSRPQVTPNTTVPVGPGMILAEATATEATFYKVSFDGQKAKLFSIPSTQHFLPVGSISSDGQIIVFADTNGNLQRYDLSSHQLTVVKAVAHDEKNVGNNFGVIGAQLSPDGKAIGLRWAGGERGGNALIDIDGQNYRATTSGCGATVADFGWSPDSERVVLGAEENTLSGDPACLYVAAAKDPGKGKELLPAGVTQKGVFNPHWSPDGQKIVFGYRYLDFGPTQESRIRAATFRGIYVVNANGSNFHQVSSNRSFSSTPLWIDNETIIYGLSNFYAGTRKGIFSIKTSGTNNIQIFSDTYSGYRLISLSPDKKYVLYEVGSKPEGQEDADRKLYVLDLASHQSKILGEVSFIGWVSQ